MNSVASLCIYAAASALAGFVAYAAGLPGEASFLAGAGVGAVMLNVERRRTR